MAQFSLKIHFEPQLVKQKTFQLRYDKKYLCNYSYCSNTQPRIKALQLNLRKINSMRKVELNSEMCVLAGSSVFLQMHNECENLSKYQETIKIPRSASVAIADQTRPNKHGNSQYSSSAKHTSSFLSLVLCRLFGFNVFHYTANATLSSTVFTLPSFWQSLMEKDTPFLHGVTWQRQGVRGTSYSRGDFN